MAEREQRLDRPSIKERMNRLLQRAKQSNLRSAREQIVFFYILIVFILVSIHLDRDSALPFQRESIPMDTNWTTAAGDIVSLSDLPLGTIELTQDISALSAGRKSLCMKSVDTLVDVYADGNCIYSYHPIIPKRLGVSYGMYVHTVALPENITRLTLRMEPVFPGAPAALDQVVIQDGSQYMSELYRNNLFAFARSSVILMLGLLFLVVGVFGKIIMNTAGLDFVSFGVLCILVGFTGYNDTLLLQVLTGHPALIRVITYVCLIFIPYPAVSFFASATGHKDSRLIPVSLVLCLANFAVQVFLTFRGQSDYYYLVYISHGLIFLAFGTIAWLLVRAVRNHTIHKELLTCLIIGVSACVVGVGLDVMRYYLLQSYGSSGYTRLGVLIFTLQMGIYLFREQTRLLRQKQKENALFISEITTAFAKVIDTKDSYTNGHSFRVAKYTAMLAKELGYDDETVEKYYHIAQLHDVGKIGIPKAVLNKPGKLTVEEYDLIKSHTIKGYDILKDISIMPELATGAQSHHERPDGRGYPNHLIGSKIPRVAQIIAVADTFDAMYSNRPYRSRMNFEKVVSIIKEVSGTQLTPDVVDAFLRLVEKGEFRDPNDQGGGSLDTIDNIGK